MRTATIRRELDKFGLWDLQLASEALALDVTLVSHHLREFRRVGDRRKCCAVLARC